MKRMIVDLKIISAGLMVLYATSFVSFWQLWRIPNGSVYIPVTMVIFAVLFIASSAAFVLKDWGRWMLVCVNLVFAYYLLGLLMWFSPENRVPIGYVFMAIIVSLFMNQSKTRARYVQKRGVVWSSILVIDDDAILCQTVRPILMNNGYSVLIASTGEEGLAVAKKQRPDLILLDVILPKMKGREVCKALKSCPETRDIPVIFLTAKDSDDDVDAEMEAGAEIHLTKPVTPELLVSTVRKVLN